MSDRLTRMISENDMHIVMAQFLHAAENIHTAMCRVDDDHHAQEYLNHALQSVLIGAEQCRQLHKSEKKKIAATPCTGGKRP